MKFVYVRHGSAHFNCKSTFIVGPDLAEDCVEYDQQNKELLSYSGDKRLQVLEITIHNFGIISNFGHILHDASE